MTTGRINQVTIVRRGWPTGTHEGHRRDFQVTGQHRERCAARSGVGGANDAARGNPLSPSKFTRAPPAARVPLWDVWHGRPSRRTVTGASAIRLLPPGGYPPMLRSMSSQRPFTHRTQPAPTERRASRRYQASPVRRAAVATGFVEVDAYYQSPAGETREPASLFKGRRSRRLQDMVRFLESYPVSRVGGPCRLAPV
jgi:hypothetical protein